MNIQIYTDGSCSGNPGDGGFGFVILKDGNKFFEYASGIQEDTTNNAEELKAATCGLNYALRNISFWAENNVDINIYTDSIYVYRGITEWIKVWKENDWCKANGNKIKNEGLWKQLYRFTKSYNSVKITWHWVKGHDGNTWNELVDKLAKNRDESDRNFINKYLWY